MKSYFSTILCGMIFNSAMAQFVRNSPDSTFTLSTGRNFSETNERNKPTGPLDIVGNIDCNTNFWTINVAGEIQQWQVENNAVEGGEIIAAGGGSGLAYCGGPQSQTFFSANFPDIGISFYQNGSGWFTIPTDIPLLNNGGTGNDQYYFALENDQLKKLYYFDGSSLEILDSLAAEFFTAADVAVDSEGQAWVFKGNSPFETNSLSVYNSAGLVTSYNINFNSIGTYGAFFLNDVLYLGRSLGTAEDEDDFIIPITTTGTSAVFGERINFPYQSYTDMANCSGEGLSTTANEPQSTMSIFPNPTSGIVQINLTDKITAISVFSLEGKLLKTVNDVSHIDLTELPNQSYILSITTKAKVYQEIIVKQ